MGPAEGGGKVVDAMFDFSRDRALSLVKPHPLHVPFSSFPVAHVPDPSIGGDMFLAIIGFS